MPKKKYGALYQPVKHHHAAVALLGAVLLFVVSMYAAMGDAAGSDRYKFTARGVVTEVDVEGKNLKVNVTHISGKGADDLKGINQLFYASSAKVYKQVSGKDKRVTFRNLAVGQEIGFKGVAKTDDRYFITWARVNDRSFTVVGTLKEVDRNLKTYKVGITSSTYRPDTYKNTDVIMNYGGNTVFVSNAGSELNADDVTAGSQKAKITGTVTDQGVWEIAKIIDGYSGK
jgi:hypothetical protein